MLFKIEGEYRGVFEIRDIGSNYNVFKTMIIYYFAFTSTSDEYPC